ncbi:hypothetical protein LSH36_579g05086 [Paralvinella palmiformis]|uniref:Uncharacterized protein n=1 Tax=Paralvinella palmiformis TaxID=53620 RepID=A0AAD9MV38_9ANNE|nr:hypothetical protein LSH36_579g05086 [Paralvinella palmiformis]
MVLCGGAEHLITSCDYCDTKDQLAHAFEELNIKPDTDDLESMKQWMLSYLKQQGNSKNVEAWGCRLEDWLDRANNKNNIDAGVIDEMLCTKFSSSLCSEVQDISCHKFDMIKSFGKLRIEMCKIETESPMPASTQPQKSPHYQSPPPKRHTVEVVQLHMDQHIVKTPADTKASVAEKITRLFYGCNLPFSLVEHRLWKDIIVTLRQPVRH